MLWDIRSEQRHPCPRGSSDQIYRSRAFLGPMSLLTEGILNPKWLIGNLPVPSYFYPHPLLSTNLVVFLSELKLFVVCSQTFICNCSTVLCIHRFTDFISCAYITHLYLHCCSLFCPCLPQNPHLEMQLQQNGNRLLLFSLMSPLITSAREDSIKWNNK